MSSVDQMPAVEAAPEKNAEGELPSRDVNVPISNDTPPSYDSTNKLDEAPPSYDSLYGKLKGAKEEASNPADYIVKLVKLLLGTLCVTIMMSIFLAVPITMIVIGVLYKDDCPVEDLIPIYLIVMGSVYIFKSLIDLKMRIQKYLQPPEEREDFKGSTLENGISHLIGCFTFAFFIAGNVWIYRNAWPNMTDPTSPEYCDPTLYYFSFWVTTSLYIIAGAGCFCACCAACVGAVA